MSIKKLHTCLNLIYLFFSKYSKRFPKSEGGQAHRDKIFPPILRSINWLNATANKETFKVLYGRAHYGLKNEKAYDRFQKIQNGWLIRLNTIQRG